jgi:hypothetical protein
MGVQRNEQLVKLSETFVIVRQYKAVRRSIMSYLGTQINNNKQKTKRIQTN